MKEEKARAQVSPAEAERRSGRSSRFAAIDPADRCWSDADKAEANDDRCREMTKRREGSLAFTHLCWCSLPGVVV